MLVNKWVFWAMASAVIVTSLDMLARWFTLY